MKLWSKPCKIFFQNLLGILSGVFEIIFGGISKAIREEISDENLKDLFELLPKQPAEECLEESLEYLWHLSMEMCVKNTVGRHYNVCRDS